MKFDTDIANLALGHLAHSRMLTDIDNEDNKEARAIRQFWPICLKKALRDFAWPRFTQTAPLAEITNARTDWAKCYREPVDSIFFRGIKSPFPGVNIPHEMGRDSTGPVIFTNMAGAVGSWTVMVDDVSQWPSDFELIFSLYLAGYASPQITAGDPSGLGKAALSNYGVELARAKSNALNENRPAVTTNSQLLNSRGGR